MAYKLIKKEYYPEARYGYKGHYVLDSAADAASLPKCAPGSTAVVADKDGAIYMVNAAGEWKEL